MMLVNTATQRKRTIIALTFLLAIILKIDTELIAADFANEKNGNPHTKSDKKAILAEEEIRRLIEEDLLADPKSNFKKLIQQENDSRNTQDRVILRRVFTKLEVKGPPYVIWKVLYLRYEYIVDAFTGKILSKTDTTVW